ncbi:MAG: hypothetical protein U9N34_05025 [Candidatus Cloacimonadota bacterium]|nr:hypothetical protein [Candidatus Cloacimonadota bacterium]
MKKLLVLALLTITMVLGAQSIYDIQFTTDAGSDGTYPSTYEGQTVTTSGIVTAEGYADDAGIKYYLSMPEGGAWKGIFVYDWTTSVAIGDQVEVTGTVVEYFGFTEITDVTSSEVLSSGNAVPAPVSLSTSEIVDGEAYEGVLVKITNVEVMSSGDYGQYYVSDGSGECQLDDEFFKPEPTPVDVSVGTTWAQITGIVDYGYDEYGLNPRTAEDFVLENNNESASWGKVKSMYK